MTHRLAYDFPPMGPLSKRPPHAVPHEEQVAEIVQELAERPGFYARLVARDRMKADEAERHVALLAAIRADLADPHGSALDGPGAAFAWADKVAELRREIMIRRNAWPARIAKPSDPLDAATAARRLERLEAVHFRFWFDLFKSDTEWTAHGAGSPPPHLRQSDAVTGRIRAHVWGCWNAEREACRRGEAWVRPAMVELFQALDAGKAETVGLWNHYRHCAERCGIAAPEAEAA